MMELTPYHAKYFAYELTRRYSSDSLQKLTASLSDAQVDLNPHQVEAALFAFKSPLSKGAVLADEVGLGKTIEAGILLSQKWAERKRRILVITPANLRKQWNQELTDKFFLPSLILETASFNESIKRGNLNPFEQDSIILCSFQFARTKEPYLRQTRWDLVIIDEAHRLRNVYKPGNKIGKSIKDSLANVPKVLLTATPLQNSLLELYGLVSIIDDYTFGDLKSFKSQFARLTNEDNFDDLKDRLKPICKRTLRRQVLEYVKYTERRAIVEDFYPTEEETRLYNLVSDYLQRPNLYALPPSQRQLMTLILRKLLASSTYAISGTLQALANKLQTVVDRHTAEEASLDLQFAGNFEAYEEVKDEWEQEDDEENGKPKEEERPLTADQLKEIQSEIESLKEFRELAHSIRVNSKGEKLFTALKRGFEEAEKLGAPKKAVIFTESTRTQEYLRNILEARGYAGQIVLFNGSNTDPRSNEIYKSWLAKHTGTDRITGSKTADKRAAIVDFFRDEATIMIATEAAAEGINLQFCSLVVNYDLPWNPQRIEQRIGRCHRYGQKYDVVVVNFLNRANAADERVYQLLDDKFKLFSGVFGASDEVLGSIESGVDFEKRIASIYQNCRTEQEIQLAFDDLQKELEPEIVEQFEKTRGKLLENFDEEVHEKLRLNLQQSKEYLGKYESWLWLVTKYFLQPYANFNHTENSFTLRENPFQGESIHPGPYILGKNVEDANVYRVGHPLAQRIIQQCKSANLQSVELEFNYTGSGKKVSIIEPFVGKSGWLMINNLTIASFETEDQILIAAVSDEGIPLDAEQGARFFSIPATEKKSTDQKPSEQLREQLKQLTFSQQAQMLDESMQRNSRFFDEEYGKLDKWAEDVKTSLEMELKELDKEIKTRKTEAKKILSLESKLREQRTIKELEKKRNEKRMNLYQAQDEVDVRKDQLLSEIEARLQQQLSHEELFIIKWKII